MAQPTKTAWFWRGDSEYHVFYNALSRQLNPPTRIERKREHSCSVQIEGGILRGSQRQARMGHGDFSSQISPYERIHVIHERQRGSDIQHRDFSHASTQSYQGDCKH
jgi:hypothetical protein